MEDVDEVVALAQSVKALSIMVVDPVSLGMLKTPGEYDIDILLAMDAFGILCVMVVLLLVFLLNNNISSNSGRIVGQTIDGNNERVLY